MKRKISFLLMILLVLSIPFRVSAEMLVDVDPIALNGIVYKYTLMSGNM